MAPPLSSDDFGVQTLTLISGLPNDVGALILAFVPYCHHARLKLTCKSWRRFFSSKTLISLRQNYVVAPKLLCIFPQDPSISPPYLFDPKNMSWCPLPLMPCNPHVYGLSNFISVAVGPHLYVIGGSLFDTRSFPLDRPSPSSSAFRFDFAAFSWESLSPMITPRGSFACAAVPERGKILVAGGGSRHTMFGAAGSRMSSVEMYDIGNDEWEALDGLPRFRAGCVGFFIGREFWVMGGYGESRTVSGVFPVDEYYRDTVVMELTSGGKWRELGDMWEEGERRRLGKIVVAEDVGWDSPGIFMLDRGEIFRYDRRCNRWAKETCVPKKVRDDASVGFVALDKELYLLSLLNASECGRGRSHKRSSSSTLLIQIYHPGKSRWRSAIVKPPFHHSLDFRTTVMCPIRL
ncbi:F-box/kelch-repeat protein OR23 [Salvia miltiorrhiza]|uniref:Kelch repeat F-box 15 protein n=1 Tax=Salvia miltiorrhiza TaxID=226208 RepID=A0A7H1K141_SALMI|nr:F-box/kelch-repeat protein OR23 [Salvia miltiorrhiza]QNT17579.1 Kelch repeat F-box 15 protein [Salvia miltiorrhiza]